VFAGGGFGLPLEKLMQLASRRGSRKTARRMIGGSLKNVSDRNGLPGEKFNQCV
jgi:hypothetical protein